MMDEFMKALSGKLAERWAKMAAPAVVFWAAAVLAWAYAGRGWSRLASITDWLNNQKAVSQIAALLGAMVVVAASTILVQRLTTPVLRLLEGYWRPCLGLLAEGGRLVVQCRKKRRDHAWQLLQDKLDKEMSLPPNELAKYARLERRRRHHPVQDNELLPTRIGNILRAAETRPVHRYGLDVTRSWPRLWLVLPETARRELEAARSSLDASVAAALWGVAFLGFLPLTWWAFIGLGVAIVTVVWWIPARAEVFADLTEASVELYRVALYQQLRWPVPKTPADEVERGKELTKYLERGSDDGAVHFTPSSPAGR